MKYYKTLFFCVTLWLTSKTILAQNQYFPPSFGAWETVSTESLNWCQAELDDLHDFLEEKDTKAFIILKNGRIAVEWYYDTFTQDSLWYWASAGKSLTSTLVGIAQEEGLLSIDDPTQQYLGEGWTNTTPTQENQITIRHQLTMTTGLDDSAFECTDSDCLNYLAEPGSRWAYHNSPYTLLGSVIETASEETLNAYYFSRIGTKIGALGAYVSLGPNRVFFSTPRSMARFGLLIQAGGVWNGTTVLGDMDYLNAMSTPSQAINPAYGYLWWLNGQSSYMLPTLQLSFSGSLIPEAPDDMFAALGKNDQKIYIVPSQNLVVIRMGDVANDNPLALSSFDPQLWEKISNLACITNVEDELLRDIEVSLYPNPTNDKIWVHSNQSTERLVLYNSQGKQVAETKEKHLSISNLPAGLYFLTIYIKGDQSYVKRVIKN